MAEERPTLNAELLVSWRRPSDPRIAPSGERVAFVVKPVSREGEHPESGIWLVPFGSGTCRPFTGGLWNDDAPRWSPDGRRLAFLSDRAERGKQSLYVMPLEGGEAQRVFDQEGDLADPQWSPDGRLIAVLVTEPETEEEKRRREERDDARVWDSDWKFRRLWLVDPETRQGRVVSPAERQVWGYAWAPDGSELALDQTPTPLNDEWFRENEVALVPRAGGETRTVLRLTGQAGHLTWSQDGQELAYIAPAGRVVHGEYVYAVSRAGGEPRCLTEGYGGTALGLGSLGDDLLLVAAEGLDSTLYRLRWDGRREPLLGGPLPARVSVPVTATQDGQRLALVRETAVEAPDVFVVDLASDLGPERRSRLNPEFAEASLATAEALRWESDPGVEVEGLLFKPAGYEPGRAYPLVVQVHGGPSSHWARQFAASWHDWAHYLASRGYLVLYPNPRGSTGRGPGYSNALFGDVGGGEFRDMMAGVETLVAGGLADPVRLGVGGWSWGGYMTAWTVSQTSRFKAAVMGAGLANLVSDNSLGDIPAANLSYFERSPYEDPESYFARSPIRHIHSAVTPTLILHGEADSRVHPAQAVEMYIALRTLGVPAQLVTYPREGHGFQERKHQLDLLQRVGEWYDRYLR